MMPLPLLRRAAVLLAAAAGSVVTQAAPLILQLDWKFNAQFAGLIVAEQKGYFREAGLEIDLRALGDLAYDQLGATVAKTPGMVGSIEAGLLLSNRQKGHDLVAIGTMFQASPLGLITLESSGIRHPRDFVGKRVWIHDDGREALAALLAREGISAASVSIGTGGYGMDDLLQGRCDVKQGYLVDELVKLRLEGHPARAFAYRDFGYIAYSQVYIVSRGTLVDREADLRLLLAAAARGWAEAVRDPAAAALLIRTAKSPHLGADYLEASLREIVPLLTAEQPVLGAMQRESWEDQRRHFLEVNPGADVGPVTAWTKDLAPRP